MRDSTRLERSSLVVRGERSELRVDDGCITVTRETATQAHPSTVTVDIGRVRNVTLQRPSRGRRGWLHLAVVGGSPAPPTELAAASDPCALPLTSRHVPAALDMTGPGRAAGTDELARRLRQLADLHREGALSDEEFRRAKHRVLGD